MLELQGTEKQIAWAEEIRSNMVKMIDDKIVQLETDKKATKGEVIRQKEYFSEAKTIAEGRIAYIKALKDVKEALLLKNDSRWFIAYKKSDCETLVCNYFDCIETVFPEVCKRK